MRLRTRALLCAAVFFATLSCTHSPIRASRGTIDRLTRSGDRFVLVFGSLSTPGGKIDRPAIRFLHPEDKTPDTPLWSTAIATGQRFYAILRAPAPAKFLDAYYVEVGSEPSGFDRIIYRRLRDGQEPLAMYVGEIEVTPAGARSAPGQKVVVETRDDFPNAQREFRRLYPKFGGAVISAILTRPPSPSR